MSIPDLLVRDLRPVVRFLRSSSPLPVAGSGLSIWTFSSKDYPRHIGRDLDRDLCICHRGVGGPKALQCHVRTHSYPGKTAEAMCRKIEERGTVLALLRLDLFARSVGTKGPPPPVRVSLTADLSSLPNRNTGPRIRL